MKVSHRLYLASLPAVLGVLTVAGLAYWGQYAHTIPELLLVIAAVASVGTLILAWTNVRYVAGRVERIAGTEGMVSTSVSLMAVANAVAPTRVPGNADELDAIESTVTRLSSAVERAETNRVERERSFEQRAQDYAQMLSVVAQSAERSLEEIRLPLHILLENHFGELNENQEELLGAARAAAEAADAEIVSLRQIAELDLGVVTMRRDRVLPADLVRAIVPTLKAIADARGVVLRVDMEPLVPAVMTDQAAMQEAMSVLLSAALNSMSPGEATLSLAREGSVVRIVLSGASLPATGVNIARARRVIAANGGAVSASAGRVVVALI
jgi:signal transduction histidine kinase